VTNLFFEEVFESSLELLPELDQGLDTGDLTELLGYSLVRKFHVLGED